MTEMVPIRALSLENATVMLGTLADKTARPRAWMHTGECLQPPLHRRELRHGKSRRMAADRALDYVLDTPNMGVCQDGGNRITR